MSNQGPYDDFNPADRKLGTGFIWGFLFALLLNWMGVI